MERFLFWFKCFVLGIDVEELSLDELFDCASVGGFEKCVEFAFDASLRGLETQSLRCSCCNKTQLYSELRFETICPFCQTPLSCPEAVGNPLGDRIDIKQDLLMNFDKVVERVGKLPVGEYDERLENKLFELLVFAQQGMYFDKTDGLGCSKTMKFKVELIDPGGKPVCHELRRYNQVKLQFIDQEVQNMLDLGVIEPYLGDWQSSVVVAPKPGVGQDLRFCVDLRDLNVLCKAIKFPFPTIEEIVHSLGDKAKYFTKLDLAKGFWQIAVELASQGYLAFVTRKGTYKFVRMPFGHKNAPAIFQALMQNILGSLLYECCFVYIDDVIVYGSTEEEVLDNTRRVLELIFDDGLKCSGTKCEFLLRRVEVLGHVINDGKLFAKVDKLQGLKNIKIPTTRTEIRSLHGLLSFFRRFVRNFSIKCRPISYMMKDDVEIVWADKQQKALERIIDDIVSCGLLLPVYGSEFIVTTDFSYNGLGGMLSQVVDGVEYPVMFCSRKLAVNEANYAPTEGEALAILFALRRFAYVLYGQKVVIRTDHRPLLFIQGGMEHNRKLARWWMLLQEFDYRLEYVTGKSNLVADGLSRLTNQVECVSDMDSLGSSLPLVLNVQDEQSNEVKCSCCGRIFDSEAELCTETWLPFVYCSRCLQRNNTDVTMNLDLLKVLVAQDGKQLIADIGVERFFELEKQAEQFEVVGDVLYKIFKDQTKEVPPICDRRSILLDLHQSGGHVGIMKLYQMCRSMYWWKSLFDDCVDVVSGCVACQKQKQKLGRLPLKPTHKFAQPYQCWSIDYLPMLPQTDDGYKHLLICVDVFSKWVELIPMKSKNTVDVWQALYDSLFSRFGLPLEIRTDRGREFYGILTNKCFEYGIKLVRISVQHPNANGQAERYVGVVKQAIKSVLHEFDWRIVDWKRCLPAVLIGLRFYQHRILGVSPYTICCGLKPRVPVPQRVPTDHFSYSYDENTREIYVDEVVEHMLWACKEVMGKLRLADERAKQKHDSDLGSLVEYVEGDMVLIKNREAGSLASKLVGPFKFVKYKDFDGYACILCDENDREFDCSVQHLVPVKQYKRLRRK